MIPYRLVLPRWTLAVATFCALAAGGSSIAYAQVAFPAPLPGQQAAPAGPSPFPPVNGATGAPLQPMNAPVAFPSNGVAPTGQSFSGAPSQGGFGGGQAGFGGGPAGNPGGGGGGGANQECMKEFVPLREDVEKKGQYLQALGKRKQKSAQDACKAFTSFIAAETKMIKYVEVNASRCGIPGEVAKQMKEQHKATEEVQIKVCNIAQQQEQQQQRGPALSLSEALGATTDVPEAKPTKRNGGSTFDTLNGNVLSR